MQRTQAEVNLKNLGIENPTEQQITDYLNQLGGETKRERDRADKYKADSDMVGELQEKLEALSNQNLSDIERANKETEKANNQIAELQKQIKAMETTTKLAELGIVGEEAEQLINADGVVDFNVLGRIISDRETKASSLKEKELLGNTPNPNEGGNKPKGDEKTDAEKFAESIGKTLADTNKASSDILASYTN